MVSGIFSVYEVIDDHQRSTICNPHAYETPSQHGYAMPIESLRKYQLPPDAIPKVPPKQSPGCVKPRVFTKPNVYTTPVSPGIPPPRISPPSYWK